MDLMQLLYKHQVALIRAAEVLRTGGAPDHGPAQGLADQIRSTRDALGVPHYAMAIPA